MTVPPGNAKHAKVLCLKFVLLFKINWFLNYVNLVKDKEAPIVYIPTIIWISIALHYLLIDECFLLLKFHDEKSQHAGV